ncbi:UNKNOWN [Stylonychia lemnae]|uniref:Uncharacterized protein n=1 Tax=Stylonychia lemnae TaxID=5949 RepID=A0A078B6L6_STYLE|nr:UNKNOWN [Stylonychia lemnae]|eukprot:CDW90014.1 UNKNOWN [Stylonychia lemnae]
MEKLQKLDKEQFLSKLPKVLIRNQVKKDDSEAQSPIIPQVFDQLDHNPNLSRFRKMKQKVIE